MRFVIGSIDRTVAARAVCAAIVMLAAACGPAVTSSRVERGDTVTTGVAAYDAFFREVAEVRGEVDKAGVEATSAVKPLSEAIGSGSKATPTEMVRAQAKKLQMSGTLIHLDLVPEAKVVTSGKPDASSEKLLAAAEQSAKGSISAARHAAELILRIDDLDRRQADLTTTLKASFPDEGKRGDMSRELSGAAAVLKAARASSEKLGGEASKLAIDLAMALETGAGSGAVASVKKPAGKGGGGGGTKPTGTAPAKPKGDDFDK